MPKALATWAIMQAFMKVNVTLKAEVLVALWAGNTKAMLISYDKTKMGSYSNTAMKSV